MKVKVQAYNIIQQTRAQLIWTILLQV